MVLVLSICVAIVLILVSAVGFFVLRKRRRTHGAAPTHVDDPLSFGAPSARGWQDGPQPDSSWAENYERSQQVYGMVYPSGVQESAPRAALATPEGSAAQEHARQRRFRDRARQEKLRERPEIRYEDEADLNRGKQLGAGGQGAVYKLIENDTRVAKYWTVPLSKGLPELEELVHRRADVERATVQHPISLCWPENPIRKEGLLTGYTMPKIAEKFYFEQTFGPVTKQHLRELQHAIPRNSAVPYPFHVGDDDRVELVYLVAVFLDALHSNDVVYGDFSWMNFTFSVDPIELCVLDFDSSRVLGSLPFTRNLPIDSPDWEDPESPGSAVVRIDSDRYKFALFAYRMLVAKDLNSEIDSEWANRSRSHSRIEPLRDLWIRSMGPAGTRPQVAEWVRALEPLRSEPSTQPVLAKSGNR